MEKEERNGDEAKKMSRYYKLIDPIETTTTLNIAKRENGAVKYQHIKLDPGEKYELCDDEVFINSLQNAKVQKRYSKDLVTKLKSFGVPYEETSCSSCRGRIKKISYRVVEIGG